MKLLLKNWRQYLEESSRWPGLELVNRQKADKIIEDQIQTLPEENKIRMKSILSIAYSSLEASITSDNLDIKQSEGEHEIAEKIDPAEMILNELGTAKLDSKEIVIIEKALTAMGLPDSYSGNIAQVVKRGRI
mgnify:CR=1 FL=1|jgi:hypothetical protein